jgi:hypothetical protein
MVEGIDWGSSSGVQYLGFGVRDLGFRIRSRGVATIPSRN